MALKSIAIVNDGLKLILSFLLVPSPHLHYHSNIIHKQKVLINRPEVLFHFRRLFAKQFSIYLDSDTYPQMQMLMKDFGRNLRSRNEAGSMYSKNCQCMDQNTPKVWWYKTKIQIRTNIFGIHIFMELLLILFWRF